MYYQKIKGGVCLVFLRDNNAAGHPCSHFCDLFAECNYFYYSSGISWYLLTNVCSSSMLFSSIIHLLVVKERASFWEYGRLELPFLSKPSAPKLLARQVVWLWLQDGACFWDWVTSCTWALEGPHKVVQSISPSQGQPYGSHAWNVILVALFHKHVLIQFPAHSFASVVCTLQKSSLSRSWPPRQFKGILPKIPLSILKG